MKRLLALYMCVMVLLGNAALAQVRVVKSAGYKSTLDISGFRANANDVSGEFYDVLLNDLKLSGWFTFVKSGHGEFRLLGAIKQKGDKLHVECKAYGVSAQRAILSKAYREKTTTLRRLAHRVADDIVEAITGHKGIASTRIVCVGTRTKHKELYLCDIDGGNLRQLTYDKSVSVAPKWGPRGSQIAYTSFLDRFPDVYTIDVTSGHRTCIARYPGLNTGANFSPSGNQVALILSKDGNPELYIKNLRNGQLTRLTHTDRVAEASPSWSPDGNQIVYVSDQSGRPQLYIISRAGGRPRRLTKRSAENVSPDWSPGNLIAYTSRIGGKYHICIINPDTGEIKQITSDYADYEDPSWAPDGRHIVCSRTQNYRSKVYLLDSMGDSPVSLMNHSGDWYSPAWAPK